MRSFLYIHLPFCTKKCYYCDFYSIPFEPVLAARYVSALCGEVVSKNKLVDTLKTIYIGGGTPANLENSLLVHILQIVRDIYRIDRDAEITIEANPEGINERKAEGILNAGINRISIGVQSLIDTDLLILGRSHSASEALRAMKIIKDVGFQNISIDLIYGIPIRAGLDSSHDKELKSWRYSLAKILEFNPQHISVYELTPEKNTFIYNEIESKRIMMPDEYIVSEMYYEAKDILQKHGYVHYEISNYAKSGYECLHNLNYWNGGDYLGLGAGAHSFIDGIRYSNVMDVNSYIITIEEGKNTEVERVKLNAQDRLKELIFLGLRKVKGIEIQKIPPESLKKMSIVISDLIDLDLLELKDNYLRLSDKGLILSSEVMLKLMEVL